MDLEQASNDINRPLNISPEQWIQRRGSLNKTENSEPNVLIAKEGDIGAVEKIDMGMDSIIKGIELMNQGLKDAEKLTMSADERAVITQVKELLDTAVAPYAADMAEELDNLEGEE